MSSATGGFHPGRLWSLLDIMRIFRAGSILDMSRALTIWANSSRDNAVMEKGRREDQQIKVKSYHQPLFEIGFAATAASILKITACLEKEECKWSDLKEPAKECVGRLVDEANAGQFFSLTPREADLFLNPRKGWESSIERFPGIVDDVEEASKCVALSRYSAAVFHSIQIIETGLIELGTFLKVNDPKSGWTAVSGALGKAIKKEHKTRTRFERKNFAFLEQMEGTVAGLKNAWRNKISHAHGRLFLMTTDFSPDVAEEILMSSRSFTRRLAEGLPPARPKKGVV
jgi:hypothetical protein